MIYLAVLTAVTAVWGWTFVLVKDAVTQYPVAPFLALRFGVALIFLLLLVRRFPERRALRAGSVIGAAVAAGYALQTFGLQETAPGTAGLITGLFVVFTPIIDRAFGGRIALRTWVAVGVALGGTALLAAGGGGTSVGIGDLLVLGSAICFALQIVLISRHAPGLRPTDVGVLQLAVSFAVFSLAGSPSWRAPDGGVWLAVVITGVLASALALPLQAWAQSRMSATRAALIFAMEPAWALFFAALLAGQRLGPAQATGAALVLAAVVGHEAVPLLAAGRRARSVSARAQGPPGDGTFAA